MPEGQNQEQQETQQPAGQQAPQLTWEQVLASLPEEHRSLYEAHTQGLRGALQSERQQHQDLARQLRDATAQLEAGSQARTQLEQMTTQLEAAQRRADFMEEAARPEIGCTNARLAWIAAQEVEAINSRGQINWDVLRQQFPELFKPKTPPTANAGAGTGTPPNAHGGMNAYIRTAAGRG